MLSGLAGFVYAVTNSATAESVSNYSTALTTESGIVDEHLGGNVDYAQLIKLYSSHDVTGPESLVRDDI